MTANHQVCPECNSPDTEVATTFDFVHTHEKVRICNDCPCEFTVVYGNAIIEDVKLYD